MSRFSKATFTLATKARKDWIYQSLCRYLKAYYPNIYTLDLTKLGVHDETGRNLPFPRDILPNFYVAHRIAGTNFTSQFSAFYVKSQKIIKT